MKLEKPTRKIEAVVPAACGNKAVADFSVAWRSRGGIGLGCTECRLVVLYANDFLETKTCRYAVSARTVTALLYALLIRLFVSIFVTRNKLFTYLFRCQRPGETDRQDGGVDSDTLSRLERQFLQRLGLDKTPSPVDRPQLRRVPDFLKQLMAGCSRQMTSSCPDQSPLSAVAVSPSLG